MREWGLTLSAPFEPAAISWVASAQLPDGTRAVLKLNFPEAESEHETDALQWWDGDGAVRLLAHDRARRALLIARCEPGAQLRDLPDETAANRIAAGVLRRLWRLAPPDSGYRTLAEESRRWAQELPRRWERHRRPFPQRLLEEAVTLCAELGGSQPELVVCHQDFHGGNVLFDAGGRWLAIDPKPLIGERAFDLASLLRDRRPTLLAGELDVERDRARGWAIVHALAWGISDEAVTPDLVECARLFAEA